MISPGQPVQETPFGETSAILAWGLGPWREAPFNRSEKQQDADLKSFLSTNVPRSLFIIPQQGSRDSLTITPATFESLKSRLGIFPAFRKLISTFVRQPSSDYYLGQSAAYFSPPLTPGVPNQKFEFCCLLKFVDKNGRDRDTPDTHTAYVEFYEWSLRQQALYHSYQPSIPNIERTVLVNPSKALWESIKSRFQSPEGATSSGQEWPALPTAVVESLSENWSAYISSLHKAVEQLKKDVIATRYYKPDIGEANEESLKLGIDIMDKLQHVFHALESNAITLRAIQNMVEKSLPVCHLDESVLEVKGFSYTIDGVVQELDFERDQVQLIIARLKFVLESVRDLLNLRSTHSMEQMTNRTILEARTMRIIAFVTLAFLPPTFIAGFLDMGYIEIKSSGNGFSISSDPGLIFYFAITIPLVVMTIGSYLYWDRRNKNIPGRESQILV